MTKAGFYRYHKHQLSDLLMDPNLINRNCDLFAPTTYKCPNCKAPSKSKKIRHEKDCVYEKETDMFGTILAHNGKITWKQTKSVFIVPGSI